MDGKAKLNFWIKQIYAYGRLNFSCHLLAPRRSFSIVADLSDVLGTPEGSFVTSTFTSFHMSDCQRVAEHWKSWLTSSMAI